MAANINWANPVFDVKTSQNYLARLQEFLATQQPGGSTGTGSSNGSNEHKRKNPSTADEVDTAAALKDRKHSISNSADHATHSHAKEGSSERESPEADDKDGKHRSGKGSTSDKRKEQNRNAQRAFRDRKEKVLRDLEGQISDLQRKNDTTVSENQNLKEMITRLQEENAKLRQTSSAPKSDFTFSIPSVPAQTAAPAFSASASPVSAAPASYNNNDILSFLASSSAVPAQPTQSPFQMINPSPPPTSNNANPSGMNGIDDFMMNWNSSAFGTELPQAVPPSVTNLTEQPANTDFASLWNSLNQGNAPAFSTPQIQQSQQQATADNNQFFSLFHNAFTPSLDGQAPASNSNPAFSQYVNNANTAPYNVQSSQNVVNSMFPFASANASSSASPSSGSTGHTKPHPHHHNSLGQSSNADSPETCASSTSGGSDPSDAQPSTPNNVQALFAGNNNNNNNKTKSKSGDSVQSLYPDIGFTSLNSGSVQNNASTGSFGNMFGNTGFESVTTPSGVFDMMNYRDPLLGNLDGTTDSFNFGSFVPGSNNVSSSSASGTNNNKRSDTLDFSEFLVASPPSTTTSPPITGNNFFQMPGNMAKESSSSSSLPTLGSLSNGPSPQSSINTASGGSNISGNHNWLPYDIPYTHPLIQHVMKDQQDAQVAKQEFENQMSTLPGNSNNPCDIDGLCADMKMKATCKDHARERIAQALQTDEQTIKLYNEYLASAGQITQQTPSPHLN